jgi:hypothetical protein
MLNCPSSKCQQGMVLFLSWFLCGRKKNKNTRQKKNLLALPLRVASQPAAAWHKYKKTFISLKIDNKNTKLPHTNSTAVLSTVN